MATLLLDLDRKDISVPDFTEMFDAQIRLVRLVMFDMGIPANEVRWVVSDLRAGSALAAADPQIVGKNAYMDDVDRAATATGIGIELLADSAQRPKHFTDEALKTSRRFIQLVNESNAGRARLKFGSRNFAPPANLPAHVDTLIKGSLPSIGSIEGKLVTVSGADGAYTIAVQDRLRNRKVRCVIPEEELPRALSAFNSRVIVRGIVWSRSDGSAIRIDVRTFEIVPPDDELPTRHDVRGILSGYERADGL